MNKIHGNLKKKNKSKIQGNYLTFIELDMKGWLSYKSFDVPVVKEVLNWNKLKI